jgi:hypothetical protein
MNEAGRRRRPGDEDRAEDERDGERHQHAGAEADGQRHGGRLSLLPEEGGEPMNAVKPAAHV